MILEAPVRWWHCPACNLRDRTQQPGVHTQFHNCPAVAGAAIPLIEVAGPDVNADGRQVAVLSEDYVGPYRDTPVTAVRTERGDGSNDVTVFAPVARSGVGAHNT